MNAAPSRVPRFSATRLRGDFFPWALALVTGLDYFETMGIPLVQGRNFKETDKINSLPVIIVNERFAQNVYLEVQLFGR